MEASAALTAMPTSGTDVSDGGMEGSVMAHQYAHGDRRCRPRSAVTLSPHVARHRESKLATGMPMKPKLREGTRKTAAN